jgi:hypothetical protein
MKVQIGLFASVLIILLMAAVVGSATRQEPKQQDLATDRNDQKDPEDEFVVCEELGMEPITQQAIDDIPEFDISWGRMVKETVALWTMFLDNDGASESDPRRDNLELYAEYLASTVLAYQEHETDIGGKLPKHMNTHLLIATAMTIESSVRPDVVGKSRGERGFLQLHGVALAGMPPEIVTNRPKLGLYLGVRWLASKIPKCYPAGIPDGEWTDDDWLGPLSVYAAGERGMRKDGTCCKLSVAKKKVNKMKMYRAWIDAELKSQDIAKDN